MIVVFSPRYRIDIGPHVFPTDKYQRVHAHLLETGVIRSADVVEPEPASWADLALVHTAEYLERMRSGAMSPEDVQQLELPWSREMVEGFRLMTGGTIQAALIACGLDHDDRTQDRRDRREINPLRTLRTLRSRHIGSGLHHAFPSHGEGFCPFNDVAVACGARLQARGLERVAIVDLDVHHGNGTRSSSNGSARLHLLDAPAAQLSDVVRGSL